MSLICPETSNATAIIRFSPDPPCVGFNITNHAEIIIYPPQSCPPPPPPPPPSPALPIHINGRGSLPMSMLLSVSILFVLVIIVLTSFVALRRRRRRRLRAIAPPPIPPPRFGAAAAPPAPNNDDPLEASLIEEQPGDHHVWYIRTTGLDAAAIEKIPLFRYDPAASPVDASDCAVCLGEFAGGDTLRLLPRCEHAFHISCIDTWLASHLNCPICRSPVAAAAATKSNSISPSASSSVLPIAPNHVPEPPPLMSIELQRAASMALQEEEEANASRMGIGEGAAITVSPSPGPSSPCRRLPGSLVENGLLPINRSVSMDAVAMGAVLLRVEAGDEGINVDRKEASFREGSPLIDGAAKQGNDRRMFGVLPKVMRSRSLSSGGIWFSFTKRGRIAQSSVLPI